MEGLIIDRLRQDEPLDELADTMTEAFANYPVPVRAFAQSPGPRNHWIRRLMWHSAKMRQQLNFPTITARLDGVIIGAGFLRIPGADMEEAYNAWWPEFIAEAGPQTDQFFTRFREACDSIPIPEPNLYIAMLGVRNAYQGKGIGKKIISEAMQIATDLPNCTGLGLDTQNTVNIAIYQSCGFSLAGQANVDDLPVSVMFRELD